MIRWLHLSDLHVKSSGSYDQDVVFSSLVKSLPDLVVRFGQPDFLIISGDIANSGKAAEYLLATEYINKIIEVIGIGKEAVFVVPGNHDIDRDKAVGLARTLDSTSQADLYFSPGNAMLHIEQRLSSYGEWYDSFYNGSRSFSRAETYSIEEITVAGKRILLSLFNSSAFCYDDHDMGKLFLGRRCVEKATQAMGELSSDLKIAVMHHPFTWLSPIESTQIKALIHDAFQCVVTGHLHENEIEFVGGSSGAALHLAAGATYQTRLWPNTALFCAFNDKEVLVTPIRYVDSPRSMWTLDSGLFVNSDTYQRSFTIKDDRSESGNGTRVPTPSDATIVMKSVATIVPPESPVVVTLRAQIEDRLFITPSGATVYAEPRLMPRSQMAALDGDDEEPVSLSEIVNSESSFFIEARAEYGASMLARLIQLGIVQDGKRAALRNAREISNYRKKLEVELAADLAASGEKPTLVLDDVDLDRDERLLSELADADWFKRFIIISVNRRLSDSLSTDPTTLPFKPSILYLWAMGRKSIRQFASSLLEANDSISESRAVSKVYGDLLSLRIPLTPSNVIMYLRVLQREGDFEPLSRVDILSRYLAESLRKPSDVATDSFNFKNKMDVLSAFAFTIHAEKVANFDERFWLNFCKAYQTRTLSEFNAKSLMNELVEARLFGTYGGVMYFRYSFYYIFFLGRYLWPRPAEIKSFFESDDCLANVGVIDVITGLSSENSEIVQLLIRRLEKHQSDFASKYVKSEFDPLLQAVWPSSEDEEEKLWQPVQAAIAEGPADCREIDELKTSMLAEARTLNQQVSFDRYTELENALFSETWMLADALKNADDVDGLIKVRAWEAVLNSIRVVLQVGTMFAPALASKRRVIWGGISFLGFDKIAEGSEADSHDTFVSVITTLVASAASKTAEDYGSVKLTPVFRKAAQSNKLPGFLEVTNFACIAVARGSGWSDTLASVIERTDKNAYYLSAMLGQLLRLLRYEVMPGKDRDDMKRLVALIQAKRNFGKQAPGAKAVTRVMTQLEKEGYFPKLQDGFDGTKSK